MLEEAAPDMVLVVADSLAAAALHFGEGDFQLIILDIRQGTALDIQAASAIRRLGGTTPLAAILPLMEADETLQVLRQGADHCLVLEDYDATGLATALRAIIATGPRAQPDREPHVLIVEDEPSTAEILSRFMAWRGYRVTAVQNGRHALDRLTQDPADIIITDLTMPELDGESLIAELSHIEGRPPVIVVTGNPITEITWSRLRRSVVELYLKPLNLHEIGQTADRIVGHRAA